MKKVFKSMMLLAAAAMAFTACNKEVDTQEPGKTGEMKKIQFSAPVNDAETKATLTTDDEATFSAAWENADEMAIEALSEAADYLEEGIATWNGSFFNTNLPTIADEEAGDWTYYGYYPTKVNIPFGSARVQNGNAYNSAYDVMMGEVSYESALLGQDANGGHMVIPMERMTSMIYFHLTSTLEEPLTSATLTVEGGDIAAESVEINNGGLKAGSGESGSITITFAEGTAPSAQDFRLWFNTLPVNATSLTLTVTTATKTATLSNTSGANYEAGKLYKIVKDGLNWESAPFFYESFDKTNGTGGNDNKWSGTIATSTLTPDNEGWTFVSAGGANQCAKFGTGSAKGSATTPALGITSDLVTLSFKAGAWNNDKTSLRLSLEGNGVLSETEVTMVNNAWSDYTVYIAGADENTKVKFYTEAVSRFFLDEIKVVDGGTTFEYLTVPSEVNVSFDATTASFEIKTGSAWTITGQGSDLADKTSGNGSETVTLTFPVNSTASEITLATLTVTAGQKTATVTVKQAGDPDAIEELTISEFLAKSAGDALYKLTGTITSIDNQQYGNLHIEDATGSVYVYGLKASKDASSTSFSSLGLEVGDQVTLIGKRTVYNNTDEVTDCYHVSHVKAPSLVVNPTALIFTAEGGTETVTATASNFNGDVTITAVSDNSQFTVTVSETTITVVAAANNDSVEKNGVITVTATDGTTSKTATVEVSQNKPVQPAQNGDILWAESFAGFSADDVPSVSNSSTTVFGGGSITYACADGGGTTKIYTAALAGGSSPELLIAKSNGTFTVSGIPTGSATVMTLTFRTNQSAVSTSTTTSGVTISSSSYDSDGKLYTVVIAAESTVSTMALQFKNTSSSNARVDDFSLIVGTPKVKETQTISFGENKSVEWIVGTDCTLNTAKQGLTVTGAQTTVTYESLNTEVATVDNNGMVTPKKAGIVTIKATAVETEDYLEATDQYTLTITDPNAGGQTVSTLVNYDFSFETIGSTGWTNSYVSHTVNYNESTVTFTSHSKQTGTITDVPVGKGAAVTLVLKEGTMSTVKFVCKQWGTKAQTITLHYSLDGGNSYTSTGVTSTNFTISSNNLPEGTNAVKITFNSSSNQVGVASAEFTHVTIAE